MDSNTNDDVVGITNNEENEEVRETEISTHDTVGQDDVDVSTHMSGSILSISSKILEADTRSKTYSTIVDTSAIQTKDQGTSSETGIEYSGSDNSNTRNEERGLNMNL